MLRSLIAICGDVEHSVQQWKYDSPNGSFGEGVLSVSTAPWHWFALVMGPIHDEPYGPIQIAAV